MYSFISCCALTDLVVCREAVTENSQLRNIVERLRFHLVNQLAAAPSNLPNPVLSFPSCDDLSLLNDSMSQICGDSTFSSLLNSPLDML